MIEYWIGFFLGFISGIIFSLSFMYYNRRVYENGKKN